MTAKAKAKAKAKHWVSLCASGGVEGGESGRLGLFGDASGRRHIFIG